jgi:hypothetical protein
MVEILKGCRPGIVHGTRVTGQHCGKIAQLAGGEQEAAQSNFSINRMRAAEV